MPGALRAPSDTATGGTLGCDPVTCTYDASGCTAGGEMGGGTTG